MISGLEIPLLHGRVNGELSLSYSSQFTTHDSFNGIWQKTNLMAVEEEFGRTGPPEQVYSDMRAFCILGFWRTRHGNHQPRAWVTAFREYSTGSGQVHQELC